MAGDKYAEVYYCTLNNGDEELAEPGYTMSRNESVLGDGVVNCDEEGYRVESEQEVYVSELDGHGIRFDETC